MSQADGQEVLVVDADQNVQRGLGQLLQSVGLQPTMLADPARAHELARDKFFAVAVIDLDTPTPNAGLELVRLLRRDAAATTIFVMAARKVFEVAVEAFRAGAKDIIVKTPEQVEYLKHRIVEAASAIVTHAEEGQLLSEVLSVHEDFLKRLMDMSRRNAEVAERGSGTGEAQRDCSILLVEPPEDAWLGDKLRSALAERGGYALTLASSGGEGLDRASAHYQIALVCRSLPDLPGSMVVSALKAQSPDTITILYTRPGDKPGKAEVIEGSKVIAFVPQFENAGQMVDRIDELRRAFTERSRERRYLQVFREENYELLKRYAQLKQKITVRLS